MKTILVLSLLAGTVALAACSGDKEAADLTKVPAVVDAEAVAAVALDGTPVELAGITFTPPTIWTDNGPSGMRQADYSYGPLDDDTEAAGVAVFYFGPDSGGGVDANIKRWLGQMWVPESDPETAATRAKVIVNDMTVHTVQLLGTYNAGMAGPMSGGKTVPKENYLLSGAVLEGPQGLVFFKLTGPVHTAEKMNIALTAMLQGVTLTDQTH
ncbi:MAG: hypothetical protein KKA42_12530 [candidate division Zixibacteria bacterium]|nr:hypothetical protein [candidate division Zixibacteria bacterium]